MKPICLCGLREDLMKTIQMTRLFISSDRGLGRIKVKLVLITQGLLIATSGKFYFVSNLNPTSTVY